MKRFGMTVLSAFLALTFVMCVLTYGTEQRYSFMEHFSNIAEEFSETPSMEELVGYWTSDRFKPSFNGVEFYPHVGGAVGSIPGGSTGDDGYIYPEKVSDGDWGALHPLQDILGVIKGFFVRAYYSILWVCNFVLHLFFIVGVLLPWNGLVERTEVQSVFCKEVLA